MPRPRNKNLAFLDRILLNRHPDYIRGVIKLMKLPKNDEIILMDIYLKTHPNKERLADSVITGTRNVFNLQNSCIKLSDETLDLIIFAVLAKQIKFNPLS